MARLVPPNLQLERSGLLVEQQEADGFDLFGVYRAGVLDYSPERGGLDPVVPLSRHSGPVR